MGPPDMVSEAGETAIADGAANRAGIVAIESEEGRDGLHGALLTRSVLPLLCLIAAWALLKPLH
jgi:hypothetical protein